jgi:hypothetical protein
MRTLLNLAGGVLWLGAVSLAEAGTLFTNPVIYVAPMELDFGGVADKATATNTFVVENMGSGRLVGTASVSAPFKILSGADYNLNPNEAQIVTVIYTPSGAEVDTQTVKFTGGGGLTATATGRLATPSPKRSKRKLTSPRESR